MMRGKEDVRGSVAPLVADPKISEGIFVAYQQFPYLMHLNEYCLSTDIAKTNNGDFVVAARLKLLLTPYAPLINRPDVTNCRIFCSFFPLIRSKNTEEINEVHLSKVIVLLQLLANPNLVMNGNNPSPPWSLLKNSFNNGQFGLDALMLLFSYGLSYETFLKELQLFINQSKNGLTFSAINNDLNALEKFLHDNSSFDEKDNLSQSCGIDRHILDLRRDNGYSTVYQDLRFAYKAYKDNNYSTALTHYKNAYILLERLKNQEGLNYVIVNDYDKRSQKCKEYIKICRVLEKKEAYFPFFSLYNLFSYTKISSNHQEEDQQALLETEKKTL